MEKDNSKNKIVLATVSLIKEDEINITARAIAQRAGVGLGLINYYFKSKEQLIDYSVQIIIDSVIDKVPSLTQRLKESPEMTIKEVAKATLDYLYKHPNISKISIMRDLKNSKANDNTQRTIFAFDEILQRIIPDDSKRKLAGDIMCSSFQGAFLRKEVQKELDGFDFQDKKQRDAFAENVIDIVIKGAK